MRRGKVLSGELSFYIYILVEHDLNKIIIIIIIIKIIRGLLITNKMIWGDKDYSYKSIRYYYIKNYGGTKKFFRFYFLPLMEFFGGIEIIRK